MRDQTTIIIIITTWRRKCEGEPCATLKLDRGSFGDKWWMAANDDVPNQSQADDSRIDEIKALLPVDYALLKLKQLVSFRLRRKSKVIGYYLNIYRCFSLSPSNRWMQHVERQNEQGVFSQMMKTHSPVKGKRRWRLSKFGFE